MLVDRSFIERNRISTNRIREMAGLSDAEMGTPVGEHWTVAILLAHLAFWDRRVMLILDATERDHKITAAQIDIGVNDLSLPLWAAVPPREALRIASETAQALDQRLETFAPDLLAELQAVSPRWVDRSLHRNEHLDEAVAALKQRG
jgi:hypothetical protein